MLPSVIKKSCEQEAYKSYIAECLRMVSENTAKFAGGRYMSMSFDEMLRPKPKDTRTGDEIAAEVIKKAGLKAVVKGGEEQ